MLSVDQLPVAYVELPAGVWLLELARVLQEAERDESNTVRISGELAAVIARRAERIACALGAAPV